MVQRLAYLRVPQHDHSDQHDIYVNAQGFIVVNFIHLRKEGKNWKENTTDDSKGTSKAVCMLFQVLTPLQSSQKRSQVSSHFHAEKCRPHFPSSHTPSPRTFWSACQDSSQVYWPLDHGQQKRWLGNKKISSSTPANVYLNAWFHSFDKHNEGNEVIPESKVIAVCPSSLRDLKADRVCFNNR